MPTTLELPKEKPPIGTVEDAKMRGLGSTVELPTTGTPPPPPPMSAKDEIEAKLRRTLEENFESIRVNCKTVEFGDPHEAHVFVKDAVREAFRRLGVDRWGKYEQDFVGDKVLAERGVTMHVNRDPQGANWRHGAYIFKGNELVYFVSMVRHRVPRSIIIRPCEAPFYVITNVPPVFTH